MYRIYFDANEGPGDFVGDDRYALWLDRSREDIAAIGDDMQDGLRVVIYCTGELEMEAVLGFDPKHRAWMAHGDNATIVHYETTDA